MRAAVAPLAAAAALAASLPLLADARIPPPARHAAFNGRHPRIEGAVDPAVAFNEARARVTPGLANCTQAFFMNRIDHFSWSAPPTGSFTYAQRYCTYDAYWNKGNGGAIWFYAGNESPVDLYVNHTGLMWENAQKAGALIVFAEHRYFGLTQPFGTASQNILQYLTHEQALADYAALAESIQANYSVAQPVILFGGSYGGMLASWGRQKYPSSFAGAIAGSAPIFGFNRMGYENNTYWMVVTADATDAGGAAPACAANVRAAFSAMFAAASSPQGLANLTSTFQMCSPLGSLSDVEGLALSHLNAWDTMAMINYPYPSTYSGVLLPAWPVRTACNFLADPALATGDPWKLLAAFEQAGNVFNNATQNIQCYDLPTDVFEDGIWDYVWCTELLPEETYFSTTGTTDMFYPRVFDEDAVTAHCLDKYGVLPRFDWIKTAHGDPLNLQVTNVVFSNGAYDPWSSGGVKVAPNPSVSTVLIDEGGHHLDLFFSDPADPPSVVSARQLELASIAQWTTEWYAERARREQMLLVRADGKVAAA